MRGVGCLSWATNNLFYTSPRAFHSLGKNKRALRSHSAFLGRERLFGGRTKVEQFIGGLMSMGGREPFTTPDGRIDMERYERMWNEPEQVPGIDFTEGSSVQELLAKVKEQVSDLPPIIERNFLPIQKEGESVDRTDGGTLLRIMQWNTLADALSTGKDNFVRCPHGALSWPSRRLRLLEEILTLDPDILTLQEVDHYGLYKHALTSCGYEGHFFPKPDSPTLYVPGNNGPDGVAIFIKTAVLELAKVDKVVLKALPHLNDTNQVSVILHLVVRGTGKELAVATTHLKAKSGWEDLRHSQGAYLASYLEEQIKDKPLIVSGDFNADYSEPVYDVFVKSKLNLNSVYRVATGTDHEPPYTTWKIRGSSTGSERESKRTIDYIWYSREKVNMVSTLALPTEEQIGEDKLPSYTYPSDHLSLAAEFTIR